mmetsp:Transcript_110208/g.290887  ORF Transcript_110208/g.290887 Transcript_110208/m.290887 type:complete len:212 (+) Transcript_110208:37-672(+)
MLASPPARAGSRSRAAPPSRGSRPRQWARPRALPQGGPRSPAGARNFARRHWRITIKSCFQKLSYERPERSGGLSQAVMFVILPAASLSMRFMIPAMTLPGPSSYPVSKPAAIRAFACVSHMTGDVTCFSRISLSSSGSECGDASTLDTTGMRGLFRSTPDSASLSLSTAGAMKSVWKAPATASGTAILALNWGLAISTSLSQAALSPETV